jgi:transcriptional regulator with XRE-family HTH domain
MEFNEKLQELRKQKGITQEELAEALYVSRTAISKWESGRGLPNIDSLKAISKYFGVSLDGLLSGEALLSIAEEEGREKEERSRDLVFGLLDCAMVMFFFIPFFAQRTPGPLLQVSLIALTGVHWYVKIPYVIVVSLLTVFGIVELAFQSKRSPLWESLKYKVSLALGSLATMIFILTLQADAGALAFIFLAIKAMTLIKRR